MEVIPLILPSGGEDGFPPIRKGSHQDVRGWNATVRVSLTAYTAKILFTTKAKIKQLREVLFTERGWRISREQTT